MVEQAIGWMVKLQSGEASADDWDACKRWRDARPDHAVAWERVQGIYGRLNRLSGRALIADLRTGVSERRQLTLADGSALWLDTNTAVDVRFTRRQRHGLPRP